MTSWTFVDQHYSENEPVLVESIRARTLEIF